MKIYTCNACLKGKHQDCERSHPAPAGHYGGSRCICRCEGRKNWRKIQERESKKSTEALLKTLADFERKSRRSMKGIIVK